MDEQEFKRKADEALQRLFDSLGEASEAYDFDSDFNAGALSVEFEDPPARFVVSPNSPVRQIWVSANVQSYKLDWSEEEQAFVLGATGQTLERLMETAIGQHLHQAVHL